MTRSALLHLCAFLHLASHVLCCFSPPPSWTGSCGTFFRQPEHYHLHHIHRNHLSFKFIAHGPFQSTHLIFVFSYYFIV
ncbi:hypothetical protein FA13DRAFT_815696 [Coprinellus micaceus]|uniref:C2H2-type domain-containing protein n=1 Tax=Coprinellus micaceus TaxID=71717 RepID=A0A4Y7T213_COPMI|nr:hypothetical protein FA13DRAFT_815696 [Coprinellus micaceus]